MAAAGLPAACIQTPRLFLVPLTDRHEDAYIDAWHESFDTLNGFFSPAWNKLDAPLSRADLSAHIQSVAKQWHDRTQLEYAALSRDTGRYIGAGSMHHLNWTVPRGRLGYWVRNSEQGRGYATEIAQALTCMAFEQLSFARLEIRCEARNLPSQQIPRKLGYDFVAVFKDNLRGRDLWNMQIYARHDTGGLPSLNIEYKDAV